MTANPVQTAQPVSNPQVGIAYYPSYFEAQEAVKHLSHHGFPSERIKIVTRPDVGIEATKNTSSTNWVMFQGASEGAMVGLVLSIVVGLMNVTQPLGATLLISIPGILGGSIVGLALRLLGHNLGGVQGDAGSLKMFDNQHIVMIDKYLSREASRVLEGPY
jgi:hypothetical protein